jgi:hypothetical protein
MGPTLRLKPEELGGIMVGLPVRFFLRQAVWQPPTERLHLERRAAT